MVSSARRVTWFATILLALSACARAEEATTLPSTPASTPAVLLSARPTLTPQPSALSVPTVAASAAEPTPAFVPSGRTVWNTVIGTSRSVGTCTRGSVLPAYGLVQVTALDDGSIEWKSQEPSPYRMTRIAPSTYRYSGPDAVGSGVVTMTVRFVDAQSLRVTREFVPDNDPLCTHIYEYGGEFRWAR
ncbi:MAG: hypothetical protein ACK4WM_05305 [Thermoflexales bacterium]